MTRGERVGLCFFIMASQAQNIQLLYDKLEKIDNPYHWVGSIIIIVIFGIFVWLTGKNDG